MSSLILKNDISGSSEKATFNKIIKKISKECIKCDKCFEECAFIQKYGKPKEIADSCNKADITTLQIAFECSLCGLCDAVCPVDIEPVAMFLEMRREVIRQEKNDLKEYAGLIFYEKTGSSKRYSWYGFPEDCESIFFPGCTLTGTRPETTFKLYQYLKQKVPNMGIVLDCCTKPSHDLGREEYFNNMFGEIKTYLTEKGIKKIYTACPNCYKVFKDYGKEFSTYTVYELIAENGLPQTIDISGEVTVHDPCVVRHEKEIHNAVRRLIKKTGLDIKEMAHSGEKTICCGEGGSVESIAPELAKSWTGIRKEENKGHRIITYCAGCTGKLSAEMPSSHLLDLLFNPEAVMSGREKVSRPPFTYWNRLRLKKRLKKEDGIVVSRERDYLCEKY